MTRSFFLVLAFPFIAHAQLLEVKQVIYGMDCAPCAHGVEGSIKALDGVQSVGISLNEGTADIRLAADNTQTLERIRRRIADNGFSPKEAHVKLTGRVHEKEGALSLATESAEIYTLLPSAEGERMFDRLKAAVGRTVTVLGLVREARKAAMESWKIQVTQFIE